MWSSPTSLKSCLPRTSISRDREVKALPPRRPLVFSPDWCRACRACEVACSIAKEGEARPALARMNLHYDEFEPVAPITATLCFQCEDAACLEDCPVEAISRDGRSGALVIDEGECTGCMACEAACPWGVPKYHPEKGVAIKCDLCQGRAEGPACVEACPLAGRALKFEPDYYVR